jgi:hypothetical protein
LFGLWIAKEPSHPKGTHGHQRDLIYGLMLTQLMTGNNKIDIGRAIDLHPASFGGAQQGARQVTAEMEDNVPLDKEGTEERWNRDQRYAREKATIKAWFERYRNKLPSLGREPTIEDVEKFIREQLSKITPTEGNR